MRVSLPKSRKDASKVDLISYLVGRVAGYVARTHDRSTWANYYDWLTN